MPTSARNDRKRFAPALIAWQRSYGRHDLPWQRTRDPYRIWLSEIMLQQTQVAAVIPYYARFLERFPDLRALARAKPDQVLRLWSGLGYYARARNLHRAAQEVVRARGGRFPSRPDDIATLPGVGRSTAAAIAVFAFGARAAILDGNVKRVLVRAFGIEGDTATRGVEARLWALAESLLPERRVETYTQALMDLGATVCVRRNPVCGRCPLARACVAHRDGRTSELPAPKRRAIRPVRRARWLVLMSRGRVLLERRPDEGLWGGLWVFPSAVPDARLARHCLREYSCEIGTPKPLETVTHGFTHFTLVATPVLARARVRSPSQDADGVPRRRWLAPVLALQQAVPAPVRRILALLVCRSGQPTRP